MLAAKSEGMTNGDYVFIITAFKPKDRVAKVWEEDKDDDDRAKEAFRSVIEMTLSFNEDDKHNNFLQESPMRLKEHPWYYDVSNDTKGSIFSLFLYDAGALWAKTVQLMVDQGLDYTNGSLVMNVAKTISFNGYTGVIKLDNNGDRIPSYLLWQLKKNADEYEPFLLIDLTAPSYKELIVERDWRNWGVTGLNPPPDQPVCGFFDEKCPPDNSTRDIAIGVSCFIVFLILVIFTFVFFGYRKKMYEDRLQMLSWKVNIEDIKFLKQTLSTSFSSSNFNFSKLDGSSFLSSSDAGFSNAASESVAGKITLGHYSGNLCTVKQLNNAAIMLTRRDREELMHVNKKRKNKKMTMT